MFWCVGGIIALFLSTPSARRATARRRAVKRATLVSIHALREEGDLVSGAGPCISLVSIHALREEGDFLTCWGSRLPSCFYPRPP